MPRSALSSLDGQQFDVIIIGGGINGASSAQHLAAEGYAVLLVDKSDFAAGSTSRSSRLLHCGLRYFETPRPLLDFARAPHKLRTALRSARAAMEARAEFVGDSAQRVRPFTLLFPVYRDGPYSGWQVDLAFRLLGRHGADVPLDYRRLKPEHCGDLPFCSCLRDDGQLHSIAAFTEYMFDWPERICIDCVLDAERLGAIVRNYTIASLDERDASGAWGVHLTDELSPGPPATVTAPVVLNTAGIWIDQVNRTGEGAPRRLILGTKGAHIVVRLPDAFRNHGIATVNSLGEPHYVLPSQGGYHHIGPTETVYEGDLDDIRVDDTEREFLLNETGRVLPGLELTQSDVIYTWAGVRPLGHDPDHPKGSRAFEIHDLGADGHPGIFAVTAGPIMTHRQAGREITARIAAQLEPSGAGQPPDYAPRQVPDNTNSPPFMRDLLEVTFSHLAHAATNEHAATLADILIARTGVAYGTSLTDADVQRAAEAVAVHLGWDRDELKRQVGKFRELLSQTYQM